MKPQHSFIKVGFLLGFILLLFLNTCKKDEEPKEDYCALVTLGSWGAPSISTRNCNSGTIDNSVSNIKYDQFSRVISYSFSITCGSKSYTGSIYNVTYDNLGVAQTCKATINGTSCSIDRNR